MATVDIRRKAKWSKPHPRCGVQELWPDKALLLHWSFCCILYTFAKNTIGIVGINIHKSQPFRCEQQNTIEYLVELTAMWWCNPGGWSIQERLQQAGTQRRTQEGAVPSRREAKVSPKTKKRRIGKFTDFGFHGWLYVVVLMICKVSGSILMHPWMILIPTGMGSVYYFSDLLHDPDISRFASSACDKRVPLPNVDVSTEHPWFATSGCNMFQSTQELQKDINWMVENYDGERVVPRIRAWGLRFNWSALVAQTSKNRGFH